MKPVRVLIVAGSDSGGGAGIQADIRTVTMFGGHAMTAITALTAQNSLGVQQVMPVPAEMVIAQIDSVAEDLGVDAVKIGMIGSGKTAAALADRLDAMDGVPIVFDPVMVATSGSVLADEATVAAFDRLARLATLTTPNIPELEALSGSRLRTLEEAGQAASSFAATTGRAVLAKGGHLAGPEIKDQLAHPDGTIRHWSDGRIDTVHSHGTGCTLSTAIACGLGQGRTLEESVERARDYVRLALRAAPGFGAGSGPMGHSLGAAPWELVHRKI